MYKKISVMFAVSILTGCAGMNSDFEHSIPAKDSGYWLQQADDMTNPNSANQNGNMNGISGKIDVKQYRLINTTGIRLPIKNVGMPQPLDNHATKDEFEPINISYKPNLSVGNADCHQKYCYPEPNHPLRRDDRVSRLWLAPYVSPDDNVHLGEIVYFVTKKSQWAGIEQSQGGK